MIDQNARKFIEENKKQAHRDLESAKLLLLHDGNLENVAFLLEQSYEKILKSVYARYRLETTLDSWKDVYKKVNGHEIDFIYDVLRDSFSNITESMTQTGPYSKSYVKQHNLPSPDLEKVMDMPDASLNKITNGINCLKQRVDSMTKNKKHFVEFMSNMSLKDIKEVNIEKTNIPEMLDWLDTTKNKIPGLSDLKILNHESLQKYTAFLNMLKTLAPLILPHVIASRYPLKECSMENLKVYRTCANKKVFNALAHKMQILLDSESDFVNQIIMIRKQDFKI